MKKISILLTILCSMVGSANAGIECVVLPETFGATVAVEFDSGLFSEYYTISVYGHSRVTYKAIYTYQERGLPGLIRKVADFSTYKDMPPTLDIMCNVNKTMQGTTCELKGLPTGDVVFNDFYNCSSALQ
jgi:hypothetical protein